MYPLPVIARSSKAFCARGDEAMTGRKTRMSLRPHTFAMTEPEDLYVPATSQTLLLFNLLSVSLVIPR